MLSLSHLLFSLNFPLINIWSPISLILPINLCYFNFWHPIFSHYDFHIILEITTFPFLLVSHSGFTKFIISYFHPSNNSQKYQNVTLGARIRPYSFMYCTLCRDGALQNPPPLEHFVLEMNKLNSKRKEREIPH